MLYTDLLIAVQNIIPSFTGALISLSLLICSLLYRYLFYRWCGCCEKSSSSEGGTLTQPLIQGNDGDGDGGGGGGGDGGGDGDGDGDGDGGTGSGPAPPRPRVRYPFLDNIKVFLIALVVTLHIANTFGVPAGELFFTVPSSLTWWNNMLTILIFALGRPYFMPLFFFISGFFVPGSYAKGREKFLRSKWNRILIPALVVTFTLFPIGDSLGNLYMTGEWVYFPYPGQAWFLYWLLLLIWVYMSIIESTDTRRSSSSVAIADDNVTEVERTPGEELKMPFPSTWKRLFFGVTLGGLVLASFQQIIPQGNFASMPIFPGSFTADFLMFYAGILAKKHGWLEKDLVEQLDMPLWAFFSVVFLEAALIAFIEAIVRIIAPAPLPPLLIFVLWIAYGAGSVDMSLAMLIIFQRWFNKETKISKILARSSYCVYLIHSLVYVAVTIVYLEIYGRIFGSGEGTEVGRIIGGFTFVNIATHAVLWPLSYALMRIPILRDVI